MDGYKAEIAQLQQELMKAKVKVDQQPADLHCQQLDIEHKVKVLEDALNSVRSCLQCTTLSINKYSGLFMSVLLSREVYPPDNWPKISYLLWHFQHFSYKNGMYCYSLLPARQNFWVEKPIFLRLLLLFSKINVSLQKHLSDAYQTLHGNYIKSVYHKWSRMQQDLMKAKVKVDHYWEGKHKVAL